MSLSSLLLGSKQSVDKDLDSLFKQAPTPISPPVVPPTASSSTPATFNPSSSSKTKAKRKLEGPTDAPDVSSLKSKKAKLGKHTSSAKESSKAIPVEEEGSLPTPLEEGKKDKKKKTSKKDLPGGEKKDKGKAKVSPGSDSDKDELDIKRAASTKKAGDDKEGADEDEDEETLSEHEGAEADEGEDGGQDQTTSIVHESLTKKGDSKSSRKTQKKLLSQDETPEQRNARTIFVGNVALEVASKRPLEKALRRHILSFVPTAKIESLRFRSVPFQTPTSKLPIEGEEPAPAKRDPRNKKDLRAHEAERAANWRNKLDEKDEEFVKKDEKKYLTPAQKKKVAFIHGEFHTQADTVNAYIVFAHPPDTSNRPANLPALPPTMDPYEAAIVAAKEADNSLFMEKMLRVDVVNKTADGDAGSSSALGNMDPKLSIFVGNLDFASKEEDLRVYFDQVATQKLGVPKTDPTGTKPVAWVTRVRIVRDRETQLGKGFAYVQFLDRECVDELLASDEPLKFAKRKLRIQRCKTVPGSKVNVTKAPKPEKGAPRPHVSAAVKPPIIVPKGDPRLGEKLAGLSKEERKQAKASDSDRLARRLAKKKARMAMGPPKINKGEDSSQKARDRTRKPSQKGAGAFKKTSSKPRVRSDKRLSRRNAKK